MVKLSSNGRSGQGAGSGNCGVGHAAENLQLRNAAERANSPAAEGREFTAAKRLQIPRRATWPPAFQSQLCQPQLGQIGDDSDATCSGPSRRRIGHTSKRESANVAKLGLRYAPNCRNWDLERVITTQCAAESHKGVYQYVEVWLRKLC